MHRHFHNNLMRRGQGNKNQEDILFFWVAHSLCPNPQEYGQLIFIGMEYTRGFRFMLAAMKDGFVELHLVVAFLTMSFIVYKLQARAWPINQRTL